MKKTYDVVIAGAGPVGLLLACELGLARASVLVLERDVKLESPWKVKPLGWRGLNTSSVESFYRRGLLGKFFDLSERPSSFQKTEGFQFGGHFAGIMLNANKLDLDRWKYRLPGPALVPGPTTIECIETALTERAEILGVTILRGNGVTKIAAQDEDSVTVEAGENQSFRGKWLVGCDGGRSVIRKAAGFDFVGTEAKFTGYAVNCDFEDPDKLKPGFHVTKTGMYIVGLPKSLHLLDFGTTFDRTQDITQDHIQEVLNRITGTTDVKITKIHLASSFTDRSKQTTSYRKGRVLLAGDAAHIHSPLGAQGLNVGLGDAMNLGWKLAAMVRQESEPVSDRAPADLALLDTYESERHPIAAWALEWTRAQVSTVVPDLYGAAVRKLISDLIDTDDGTNLFIGRVWGLSQRYSLGDSEPHAHPLVGCSAPDFELHDGSRLGSKLEGGRGLFLDFEDDAALKELIVDSKYRTRVDYVTMGAKDRCDLHALLIRPDGVVAWVAEENAKPDVDAAKAALDKWFGF
ncbi:FAD binding domain-containing protein [Rhizodiscina lignyota]|uniref:FAD binding domain-containing protein n=1 Tax=Rhizodiscina lignyota TaxID=1504668 RepID=A0A9P4II60_9PEZI|nr:FAD binding domain-containing protein [Rhizodiscina lignyota]